MTPAGESGKITDSDGVAAIARRPVRPFLDAVEFWNKRAWYAVLRPIWRKAARIPIVPRVSMRDVRRLLILRFDKIGDMIVTLPIIDAIRRECPWIEIGIWGSASNLVIVNRSRNVRWRFRHEASPPKLLAEALRARRARFDLVFNAVYDQSTRGAIIARIVGGVSIGQADDEHAFLFDAHTPRPPLIPMTDSLATVLRATTDLTLPQEFLTAEFPRDPAIAARAIAWLASEGVPAGNFLLLNCSAGEPTRTLSELQARSIVRRAREELRMSIVLNAVGDERGWAENIVREHFNEPGARLRIAPASEGFLFLCEIARVSRALVSPDTSIIHAAALFRIPIVGLYRDPLLYREWAPYRAAHRALISTSGSVGGIDPDPAFSELRIALGED